MKSKVLILFFCLAVIPSLVMGGTRGKIAGKVIDAQTGKPLPGVNIFISGTSLGAATDNDGEYFIINVPPGTYTLVAKMMGYTTVNKTGVIVNVDRTITVDFKLSPTVIKGKAITVVAKKEVVRMDVSSAEVTATAKQIAEVPLVRDVNQYIRLQAGVEGELIRGGGLDQTGLLVDGLPMVDNVHNEPLNLVNLSAIEEVNVIKGGFNAEYGNIRAGLINITTKEGSSQKYHASLDYRYTLPHLKHRGYSIFDYRNYYLRSYLDPDVCWVGTKNGKWNLYAQRQYPEFEGWNSFSQRLLSDDDPSNDLTPEQARDLFIWQHRADGNKALGIPSAKELGHPHPGVYGNKPDINMDLSFSGPVPVIGKYLGNMSFFASYRELTEPYVLPAARSFDYTRRGQIKLTSRISPSMKLVFESFFGLNKTAGVGASNLGEQIGRGIYFVHGQTPMDINQSYMGVAFDHVLSPRTFYNIRFSRLRVKDNMYGARVFRDTTRIRKFGSMWVDEQPWGWYPISGYQYALADQMVIGGVGGGQRDFTKTTTYNVKFDLTSQITKHNQIKTGFEFNYDDHDVFYGEEGLDPTGNYKVQWRKAPIRVGAYIQNRLEFEGMIANIGLRLDYDNPNTKWYTVDRYSKYFSRVYKDKFAEEAPQAPAKGHLRIAPRIGISHPISSTAKLYFNYGHFYSMPTAEQMYEINYGVASEGISAIGNPSLRMPRTIAYELGYEQEIAGMFLLSITGYYRDVTDEIGYTSYINYDESVSYWIPENTHYADIRGIEVELRKSWGKWVTGWVNYTYMVHTNGLIGREANYQDPRKQVMYGKRNPIQEKPLPEPYGRAYIEVRTPFKWGPSFGNTHPLEQIAVSLLGHYHRGDYFTWEPVPPYKLQNNVHWKDRWDIDARITKDFSVGKYSFTFFADIVNVFDIRYLTGNGFSDERDFRDYMNSLHLPMYAGEKYKNDATYTAGHDKVGDVWSKDKPYINMPNIDFAAWNPPRSITLGVQVNF